MPPKTKAPAPEAPEQKPVILTGSPRESQSLFRSPYYAKSYDYPYNPDPLVEGQSYRIYEEMKQDEAIHAVLSIKKDFVIGSGWRIVCEDKKVQEFVERALNEINEKSSLDTSFEGILRDMLSAYDYGFSLSEPVYEQGADGLYTYKTIKTRPPHGFRFYMDDFGNVTEIQQSTDKGDRKFKPGLFLHHVHQQEFGNPFGLSDFFSIHPAWKAKTYVARFMNMYLEGYAAPTVVGKYQPGMEPAEVTKFMEVLESIANNRTSLAIPNDTAVSFEQAARDATDAYLKALNYYNIQIARGVLVPDLMGLSGEQTSGGAYSLGEKHFQVFMGTINKDRKELARKFTMKIVRPLVLVNFGDIPCSFEFIPYESDKLTDLMKLWLDAANGKLFKPNPEEINHLRKQTGFPEGPVVDAPEPIKIGLDGKPLPGQEGGDKRKPGEKPEMKPTPEERENALRDGGVLIFREMTRFEAKIDFSLAQKTMEMSERAVTSPIQRAARDVIADFISQARDRGLVRRRNVAGIDDLQARHLKPMNAIFKSHFKDLFRESFEAARREILPESPRRFAEDALLPETMLEVLEQESFKLVGDYATTVTKKARNLMIQAVKDGIPESEVFRLVRDEMEDASDRWLTSVLRTKTTEVYNDARKSYWDNDEFAKQIVEAYQFSAILDERTTDCCAKLDGKTFEKGEFINRLTPPLHINCRSLLVPVTKYEDYRTDRHFVPVGKEPSFESLREMGAGLLVG